jgi:two-component system, OmpR family, phosphate regulon sensor histidine kinase PhoR
MHPLRVLLYVSVVIAVAVAWAFGAALDHAGVAPGATIVFAVLTFFAFMVPWMGVSLWALRRARDLDELTELARRVTEGELSARITYRAYHAELDDLARAVDEMRSMIIRQQQAHDEHRAAMQEIVASLGEGIVAVNPRGRVVVANARVAEMFGGEGTLIGKSILEVVRRHSVSEAIDKALRGEPSHDRVVAGSEDAQRQIEVRVFPVVASPEIAAVALFIDVTTIERLQRVRKEFLDDFSHEVRTPLTGLRSAAETLEQGGHDARDEQQLRHVLSRQIARIERLVDDLSELNRIETGEIVLERRRVSLRDLLAEVSQDFPGVEVRGEDVVARIDAARVQQVFSNIADNARKHGRGPVIIDLAREDGDAVVRVSDEGPGIPAPELSRIFNRFYRVDRSRSQPGTGLGLAIAKHLVAAHGGSIRACNRPEGGVTFEVRLPVDLT